MRKLVVAVVRFPWRLPQSLRLFAGEDNKYGDATVASKVLKLLFNTNYNRSVSANVVCESLFPFNQLRKVVSGDNLCVRRPIGVSKRKSGREMSWSGFICQQ